jgi:hypothetical protein
MFRLVVTFILALTVGWKVALGLTNNPGRHDNFKPALTEFLVQHRFTVFDANHINGVEAVAGDCRLLISWTDIRVWKEDIIKDVASVDDRVFFVYRQAIYSDLPAWSIVAYQYWSNFLRKVELKHPVDIPVFAVTAPTRCDAERLPWHELQPSVG